MYSFEYSLFDKYINEIESTKKLYDAIITSYTIYDVIITGDFWYNNINNLLKEYVNYNCFDDPIWIKFKDILFNKSLGIDDKIINYAQNDGPLMFYIFNSITGKNIPFDITLEHEYFCNLKLHKYDVYTAYSTNILGFGHIYIDEINDIVAKHVIINKLIYTFEYITEKNIVYIGLTKRINVKRSVYNSLINS